jgi:hypothetical protein
LLSQSAIGAVLPAGFCGAEGGRTRLSDLLPHLRGLVVERIECPGPAVEIVARSLAAQAACRACSMPSSRVHSGYERRIQDAPAGGRPVVIRLAVRRFLCRNPGCPAVTFAEQVEGLTARYLRRSLPLLELLSQITVELAGRAGARLAAAMSIGVHRATLLRLAAALPEPQVSQSPSRIFSRPKQVQDGPAGLSADFEALRWFPLPPACLTAARPEGGDPR